MGRGACGHIPMTAAGPAFCGTAFPDTISLCFPAHCCCSTQPAQAAVPAALPQPAVSREPLGRVAEINSGGNVFNNKWRLFVFEQGNHKFRGFW